MYRRENGRAVADETSLRVDIVGSSEARNATNLMAGSGVQQTRGPIAEKAVEVVRNHAGGTGRRGVEPPTRENQAVRGPGIGVDAMGVNRRRGARRARPREEEPVPPSGRAASQVPAESRAL